jgi:hypothetical protein
VGWGQTRSSHEHREAGSHQQPRQPSRPRQEPPPRLAAGGVGAAAAASPFCPPEEVPFLLLGFTLRPTWRENPYGEEWITLLEKEMICCSAASWRPGVRPWLS